MPFSVFGVVKSYTKVTRKNMKPELYVRNDYARKDGDTPIYLRVFISKKYIRINLEIFVKQEEFDAVKQRIVSGSNMKAKNLQLKELVGRAAEIILKYQVLKRELTADLFIKEFKNPTVFTDFYVFMNDRIRARDDIGDGTRRLHLSVLNKLKAFRECLMIAEIDEMFLESYSKYCKSVLKNEINTVHKDMKTIKTYILMAIKMEIIARNPFDYYKLRKQKTVPTFLTSDELEAVERLFAGNGLIDSYKEVLRQFLFMCYTGLRISDLKALKYKNIVNHSVFYIPIKTSTIARIVIQCPLTKKAMGLLGDLHKDGEVLVFPVYAEQRLNSMIKDAFKPLKINKVITNHVARHTFATIFLQRCKQANGILILQKLLGHANINTTMVYTHILPEDVETAMKAME